MACLCYDDRLLFLGCGNKFAIFNSSDSDKSQLHFNLCFEGTTSLNNIQCSFSASKGPDENTQSSETISSLEPSNIVCCSISVAHKKAVFGTDLKYVWVFDLPPSPMDCQTPDMFTLVGLVRLEKRPVVLHIVNPHTILVGEKAGYVTQMSLRPSAQLVERKKLPDSSFSFLCRKQNNGQINSGTGLAIKLDACEIHQKVVAGCVSSLLIDLQLLVPSRSLFALCDRDMKVKVYRWPQAYILENVLMGHEDYVTSCCFLKPDLLISASKDGTVKAWNLTQGLCIASVSITNVLEHDDNLRSVNSFPVFVRNLRETAILVALRNPDCLLLFNAMPPSESSKLEFQLKSKLKVDGEITSLQFLESPELILVLSRPPQESPTSVKIEQVVHVLEFKIIDKEEKLCTREENSRSLFTGLFDEFFDTISSHRLDFETVTPNSYQSTNASSCEVPKTEENDISDLKSEVKKRKIESGNIHDLRTEVD